MKKKNFFPFFLLLSFVFVVSCRQAKQEGIKEELFHTPPVHSRVHTWWHWMNGNITKEGITRDLESMKRQGISEATILNIGLISYKDSSINHVVFNTPEWYHMFRWALQEASRLGITIGVHNSDGWSSSGGPWITPEKSMKQYVWSKTVVEGGKVIKQKLATPYAEQNFYTDVAVVAFPSRSPLNSFVKQLPRVKLNDSLVGNLLYDGCPVSGVKVKRKDEINIHLAETYPVFTLVIHPRKVFMWDNISKFKSQYTLLISDDGKKYRPVKTFELQGLNASFAVPLPAVKASYYRLRVDDYSSINEWISFMIAEVELLGSGETPLYNAYPFHLEKTSQAKASLSKFPAIPDSIHQGVIFSKDIRDITSCMNKEGELTWEAPQGYWTIIRFGYTTTSARNAPATKEGEGLECDKMDSSAIAFHFRNFPAKLVQAAGEYTGNTFKFLLIDSWECGFQNWTASFEQQFLTRRSYALRSWIPALCGEIVDNPGKTDAFLHDYRTTIADLIEENYYRKFRDLCHAHRLEMHAEIIYGGTQYPPLDVMKANQLADMPMFEFWAGHNHQKVVPESNPRFFIEHGFPQYAATAYGLKVTGAEAYTAMAHLSESPWELKPFGDKAYCSGINQFILHSYVHQPNSHVLMTLGPFSSLFNRNNPYWNHLQGWLAYHARIQYVLQKGVRTAPLLHFIGDQLPQTLDDKTFYPVPVNYTFNLCNHDVLCNRLRVDKGKLVTPEGIRYELLTLPDEESMELSTLNRLSELVLQGAVIYGPEPSRTLSLANKEENDRKLKTLARKMWGKIDGKNVFENSYGKGKVIWGKPLATVLSEQHIVPDFSTAGNDSIPFLFIKKQLDGEDVFFVVNQQNQSLSRECIFKTEYKKVKILYPENGKSGELLLYRTGNGMVRLPYSFAPYEAVFFVFSDNNEPVHYSSLKTAEKILFPSTGNIDDVIPLIMSINHQEIVMGNEEGEYVLETTDQKICHKKIPAVRRIPVVPVNGKITFYPYGQESINEITFNAFGSLTENQDPSVKYFSGEMLYAFDFIVDTSLFQKNDSLFLSLGKTGCVADVVLNGKSIGNVWTPYSLLPVKGILNTHNTLQVTVANEFRNRIIGDLLQYGKVQHVQLVYRVEDFLKKDTPLKPSGLPGPVEIVCLRKGE